MRREDCFYLGKIVRKYSYKGELLAKLDTDEPLLYENMESVWVMQRNQLVPFFIDQSSFHKSTLLRLKFEDVTSEIEAEALLGCALYLPLEQLPPLKGNKFYYHEVTGFKVYDEIQGFVGRVFGVNDSTAQPFFIVKKEEKEILIPITDEIIMEVNREDKMIKVSCPEGLIALYLDNG